MSTRRFYTILLVTVLLVATDAAQTPLIPAADSDIGGSGLQLQHRILSHDDATSQQLDPTPANPVASGGPNRDDDWTPIWPGVDQQPVGSRRPVTEYLEPAASNTEYLEPAASNTEYLEPAASNTEYLEPAASLTDRSDPPVRLADRLFTLLKNRRSSAANFVPITTVPARLPTGVPTTVTARLPTGVPTTVPARLPTGVPTTVPARLPTGVPTTVPARLPTDVPSTATPLSSAFSDQPFVQRASAVLKSTVIPSTVFTTPPPTTAAPTPPPTTAAPTPPPTTSSSTPPPTRTTIAVPTERPAPSSLPTPVPAAVPLQPSSAVVPLQQQEVSATPVQVRCEVTPQDRGGYCRDGSVLSVVIRDAAGSWQLYSTVQLPSSVVAALDAESASSSRAAVGSSSSAPPPVTSTRAPAVTATLVQGTGQRYTTRLALDGTADRLETQDRPLSEDTGLNSLGAPEISETDQETFPDPEDRTESESLDADGLSDIAEKGGNELDDGEQSVAEPDGRIPSRPEIRTATDNDSVTSQPKSTATESSPQLYVEPAVSVNTTIPETGTSSVSEGTITTSTSPVTRTEPTSSAGTTILPFTTVLPFTTLLPFTTESSGSTSVQTTTEPSTISTFNPKQPPTASTSNPIEPPGIITSNSTELSTTTAVFPTEQTAVTTEAVTDKETLTSTTAVSTQTSTTAISTSSTATATTTPATTTSTISTTTQTTTTSTETTTTTTTASTTTTISTTTTTSATTAVPTTTLPPSSIPTSTSTATTTVLTTQTTSGSTTTSPVGIGGSTVVPPVPVYVQFLLDISWPRFCAIQTEFRQQLADLFNTEYNRALSFENVVLFNVPLCGVAAGASSRVRRALDLILISLYMTGMDGRYDRVSTVQLEPLWRTRNATRPVSGLLVRDLSTVSTPPTSTVTSQHWTSRPGIVTAVVLGCIATTCLTLLLILLVVLRQRRKAAETAQRCNPVSLEEYGVESVISSIRRKNKFRRSVRSYMNQGFDDHDAPSNPVNFAGLANLASDLSALKDEFESIPSGHMPTLDDMPPGTEDRNRYANVLPVPETRVVLNQKSEALSSDYINANYVRGPMQESRYYIATQGPLESTISDFWRMIWETECRTVVCLTDVVERGVRRCAEYLPPSDAVDRHRLYGDFQVTLTNKAKKDKYVVSSVQLKSMESDLYREITHIWYSGWPERGVPTDMDSMLQFMLEIRKSSVNNMGPMVVHCSPGTGRTGVVLACDTCIRQFDTARGSDVMRVVYKLRQDRAGAVQTREQYALIYKVLNHYAAAVTSGNLPVLE